MTAIATSACPTVSQSLPPHIGQRSGNLATTPPYPQPAQRTSKRCCTPARCRSPSAAGAEATIGCRSALRAECFRALFSVPQPIEPATRSSSFACLKVGPARHSLLSGGSPILLEPEHQPTPARGAVPSPRVALPVPRRQPPRLELSPGPAAARISSSPRTRRTARTTLRKRLRHLTRRHRRPSATWTLVTLAFVERRLVDAGVDGRGREPPGVDRQAARPRLRRISGRRRPAWLRPAGPRHGQERPGLRLAGERPRARTALDGRSRAVRSGQPGAESARLRSVTLGGVCGHGHAGGQDRHSRRLLRRRGLEGCR